MLLIDPPLWPAHGRLWSHLVSDTSLEELHAFARAVGIPERGFEGDHYDIPEERYAQCVSLGAVESTPREVVRALQASGLRLPKRKGDKGIARMRDVRFADGTSADVDLIAGREPFDERRVFAAAVLLLDAGDSIALVHSVRRDEWGPPGGWREGQESVWDTAIREVHEECGLRLDAADLVPVGYERFHRRTEGGLWRAGQDVLQVFRADLAEVRPPMTAELDDTSAREWVSIAEFERRCGDQFHWPLAARVIAGG